MTSNSSPDNLEPDADDPLDEADDFVEAVFIGPRQQTTGDPYDLSQLFLSWAWGTGYRDWDDAVRVLARGLRGLQEAGLIERRTIRRPSGPTHHGFVLTEDGQEVLRVLSGQWIADATKDPE